MKFIERILLGLRWRLERTDRGIAVLRAARWVLSGLFPYTPPHNPLPSERTQALVRVEVRDSSIAGVGKGLFVLEPVAAGTLIGEYCGDMVDSLLKWLRLRDVDYAARTQNPSVRIDAARRPEVQMRYVNHHADATARNVEFQYRGDRRYCVATRAIAAGEELFVDYGDFYWKLKGVNPAVPPSDLPKQSPQVR